MTKEKEKKRKRGPQELTRVKTAKRVKKGPFGDKN